MKRKAIRLALPLIGRGVWTGGLVYLRNSLRVIRSRLAQDIEAWIFMSRDECAHYGAELAPLVDGRLIVVPEKGEVGRAGSLVRALVTGRNAALERALAVAGVDVAMEVAGFYGWRFPLPVIAWLPDLQHRHMPDMFSRTNWWRREMGFQAQVRSGRTIMVSSETARRDISRFYAGALSRTHVVRFAIDLDIGSFLCRNEQVRSTYGLPSRFYYLPNQFWRHKNHVVIVRALARLKAEGALSDVPPIILSGLNEDPRNPGHFDSVMAEAREAGIESHFRYLGLIPYEHVLCLAASCDMLINPSSFEGWSTPIEEAKALGSPLMLSDIPIHREQAPEATFFDRNSDTSAAAAILNVARRPPRQAPCVGSLVAEQDRRLARHATSLLETVRAAVDSGCRALVA